MVPDSIDRHEVSNGAKNTLRGLIRLIRTCGGECDWAERRIAAYLDIPRPTYRDHRRQLEAAGEIEIERRRRHGCRQNDTNLLRLREGGLKNQPQKLKPKVNTNTKAPREIPREVSTYTRVSWEHNRAMNHPPAMREEYDFKARLIAENESLRKIVRGRDHAGFLGRRASVGTNESLNRVHGGLSWEERNPEANAWYERELAKQYS